MTEFTEFNITTPDGRRFKIRAPEGATRDDAMRYFQDQESQRKPLDTSELSRLTTDFDRPTFGGAAGRGALNVAQAGFSDELAGLAEASGLPRGTPTWLTAPVGGARMYFGDEGAKQRYEKKKGEYRTQEELDIEHRLGARLLGQVGAGAVQGLAGSALLPARLFAASAAARAAPEASLLARMGQQATIGTTTGGIHGYGSGDEGDRGTSAAWGAGLGGALGVAGEGLATGIGSGVRRVFGGTRTPAPGVNPQQRIAEAGEFNIPLSRGDATGNLAQQGWEQAAEHGAKGEFAAPLIQGLRARQLAARQAAQEAMGPTTPREAGEQVGGAMRRTATGLRESADDLYAAAAAKDANLEAGAVSVLANRVADDLTRAGLPLGQVPAGAYPGATRAMNVLQGLSSFRGSGAQTADQALNQRAQQAMSGLQGFTGPPNPTRVAAVSLDAVEEARKALVKIPRGADNDGRIVGIIKDRFDDWLDDVINARLFSGDATALDDLKEARSLWSHYKRITTARPNDPASRVVARITSGEHSGEAVANWLLGASNAGQANLSAQVAARIRNTLRADSPEWQALGEALAHKILNPTVGQGGPQAVANSIRREVDTAVARVVLPAARREEMRRYANVLRYTVPDPRMTNPSRTSHTLMRQLGGLLPAAAAIGGTGVVTYGDFNPAYAVGASIPLALQFGRYTKGRAALNPLPSPTGMALERGAARGPMSLYGTGPTLLPGLYGTRREDQPR